MDKVVSLTRRRGFVFPSSEIYGGLGSTYDYGHYGVLMKNEIRSRWVRAMVQERDDIVALDSAIILNPRVWEASPTRSSTAARASCASAPTSSRTPNAGGARRRSRARTRSAISPRRASST
jgi:hypothetical protein